MGKSLSSLLGSPRGRSRLLDVWELGFIETVFMRTNSHVLKFSLR